MPDQTVTLADAKWQQVLFVLANATGAGVSWAVTNPLLMEIGEQLRQQLAPQAGQAVSTPAPGWRPDGSGQDLPEEDYGQGPAPSYRRVPRA